MCRYLAAKCLLEAKDYNEALDLLNADDRDSNYSSGSLGITESLNSMLEQCDNNTIKGIPAPNVCD